MFDVWWTQRTATAPKKGTGMEAKLCSVETREMGSTVRRCSRQSERFTNLFLSSPRLYYTMVIHTWFIGFDPPVFHQEDECTVELILLQKSDEGGRLGEGFCVWGGRCGR